MGQGLKGGDEIESGLSHTMYVIFGTVLAALFLSLSIAGVCVCRKEPARRRACNESLRRNLTPTNLRRTWWRSNTY
jgi:hypothetical protein